MKRLLTASIMLAVVCITVVAQAQPQPPTLAERRTPLDRHFNACMSNKGCSIQVRLQIIQEENDEMKNHFQKIHQVCADANFQDCIDKQKSDVDAWYAAQNNMQKLMQSMQAQDMNEKKPAAGDPSSKVQEGKKKSLWGKMGPFGEKG